VGNGQASAAFKAISDIVGIEVEVEDYYVHNLTHGGDSFGEATVRLRQNGFEAVGRAAATDVIEASARAFLNAINRLIIMSESGEKAQGC
jgi:2-isopropylmalate synthase